jgi:SAM-dependent methyltransferase
MLTITSRRVQMTGLWSARVVPRIVNVVLGSTRQAGLRAEVCAAMTGDVVELGFGSGLNIPHYPDGVRQVTAIEPSDLAWSLSAERRQSSAVPVVRSGLDGQDLPFEDGSFDTALSTWTLCTIPDPVAALREVRRVLRPGGQLLFLEHGAAPDRRVRDWQQRFDPIQRRLFAGCHVSRPIADLLEQAGLPATDLTTFYTPGEPKLFGSMYQGRSTRPPTAPRQHT